MPVVPKDAVVLSIAKSVGSALEETLLSGSVLFSKGKSVHIKAGINFRTGL